MGSKNLPCSSTTVDEAPVLFSKFLAEINSSISIGLLVSGARSAKDTNGSINSHNGK